MLGNGHGTSLMFASLISLVGATAKQTSRSQASYCYSGSVHSHCRSEVVNMQQRYRWEKSRRITEHPSEHAGGAGHGGAAAWARMQQGQEC